MSLPLGSERHVALELARDTARKLVAAESAYFPRLCLAGRSAGRRDLARAHRACDWAATFRDALRGELDWLGELGLGGIADDLLGEVGRGVAEARAGHCRAMGLDLSLVLLVHPAIGVAEVSPP